MPTFFCPSCFAEIDAASSTCTQCGADVQAGRDRAYPQRLLHALKHPLSDIRMTAIEALAQLQPEGAAMAFADCALGHPRDPVQGVAILRALERLPRDPAWAAAVSRLVDHPAAIVGRGAQALLDSVPAGVVRGFLSPDHLRALIDDYASHAQVSEYLAVQGRAAMEPLRVYLREGPQINPQGRVFAVTMLARLGDDCVIDGLREVLYAHPLHELTAPLRESEYVVKDAVITHAATRDYPQRSEDIAFALRSERLPAAVVAAGRLGMGELAPGLVRLLEDDVLAQAASHALIELGQAGQAAILAALPDLLAAEPVQLRSRLAALRGLLTLWDAGASLPPMLPASGQGHHPAVAATCALFRPAGAAMAHALIRGAVGDCRHLVNVCRERLLQPDYRPWLQGAVETVAREPRTPDIYGNQHALSLEAERWLHSLGHPSTS